MKKYLSGRNLFLNLFLLVLLMLLLPSSGVAKQSLDTQKNNHDFEYIIGQGDILDVVVWKEPDLSGSNSVRIDGRISLPLIGDVHVAGKTIKQLNDLLNSKYSSVITDPTVSVILRESKSWRYYVIGQVRDSGEFNIDYPITVLQAIAKCGGFSEWAKTDEIKIIRSVATGSNNIVSFDFKALSEDDDVKQDVLIRPGDTILVP